MLKRGFIVAVLAALAASAGPAAAAPVSAVQFKDSTRTVPLDVTIPCTTLADGVRSCVGGDSTRVATFDGVPLDVNVYLPPAPAGPDGSYPLVIQIHGYGQKKDGIDSLQYLGPTARQWAQRGYVVVQPTARGFGRSCGDADSRLTPGCLKGWVHLADTRYEVRDDQELAGELVDSGLVDPARIGSTGNSYGGGQSMAITTLRDRIMNPDGSYKPWTSPKGTPISLAGAAPVIPWSDLVYSLVPNGRTLDYLLTSQTDDLSPSGVEKQSFVAGLFATGAKSGFYAPPGADAEADLTTWFATINAGEPYDGNPEIDTIKDKISRFHSSYYLDSSRKPAPTLIANGWTDDLFPVDEALRWQRKFQALYPDLPVSLMFFDFGHQRGSGREPDVNRLRTRIGEWFDRYVKGGGSGELQGVETLLTNCPKDLKEPSTGPFDAASWAAIHPGEIRYVPPADERSKTLLSAAGDPSISAAVDPVGSMGNACATTASGDQAGTATWRLPAVTGSGYTLMGQPTIVADLDVTGEFSEIAGRLWDVDLKSGKQTLVARGIYRPGGTDKRQPFQLHANGWHFAAGHQPKLELLGQDPPYARKSNGQFQIAVSNLDLRLPVHEIPAGQGSAPNRNDGTVVQRPAAPFVPGSGATAPKPSHRVRVSPLRVAAATSPRRDRHRPFRFTTRGRVTRPLGARQKGTCSGRVTVLIRGLGRVLSKRRVTVHRDCTYRSVTTLRSARMRRARLKVQVRFAGNRFLKARSARAQYVRLG